MARSDLVKRMLTSYQAGDDEGFRGAASEVIEDERRKQHRLLADELQQIMSAPDTSSAQRRVAFSSLRPLPKAKDESELVTLLNPSRRLEDQVLRDELLSRCQEILEEHARAGELRAHGLQPVRSLLFTGPSGTGKSTTAEALASELGVPLARVNLAAVVSSLLGETSRNLAAIFETCSREPWVVLFDEFDALGRERSDSAEHGELKRVVAAFLQLLDAYSGPALLIAATNHPAMLDDAAWRRFDDVLGFDLPTQKLIEHQVRRSFRRRKLEPAPRTVAQTLRGRSQADVELVTRAAMKRSVLRGSDAVSSDDLAEAVRRLEQRRATIRTSRA